MNSEEERTKEGVILPIERAIDEDVVFEFLSISLRHSSSAPICDQSDHAPATDPHQKYLGFQ